MNKTISINLGGMFFQLSEEAYNKLEVYLNALKAHFATTEGHEEIMSDIEFRMAEIFQTKINASHTEISMEDVEEAIGILGKPEDFGEKTSTEEPKKKFTKDPHRMYRDEDGKVLGGVCSGFGHYLNVDPIWFRILFIVSLFFAGTGILIYLILWIIIPVAKTTDEKLNMRGSRFNISDIEQQIKSEIHDLKDRIKDASGEAKRTTKREFREFKREMKYRKYQDRKRRKYARAVASQVAAPATEPRGHGVGSVLGEILHVFFKALLILAGVALLVLASFLTLALILSLVSPETFLMPTQWGITTISAPALFAVLFETVTLRNLAYLAVILLIGVPLLMMIFNSSRLILGFRKKVKVVSMLASFLWLTGLIIGIVLFLHIFNSFNQKNKVVKNFALPQTQKTLYINFNHSNDSLSINEDEHNMSAVGLLANCYIMEDARGEKQFGGYPCFRFLVSEKGQFGLTVTKMARGNNKMLAYLNANNINYGLQIKDSVVTLDEKFLMDREDKWRNQKVTVTVERPEGKQIYVDPELKKILYNQDYQCNNNLGEDEIGRFLVANKEVFVPIDSVTTDSK